MTLSELFEELRRRNLAVEVEGNNLRVRPKPSPELVAAIRENKAELLAVLSAIPCPFGESGKVRFRPLDTGIPLEAVGKTPKVSEHLPTSGNAPTGAAEQGQFDMAETIVRLSNFASAAGEGSEVWRVAWGLCDELEEAERVGAVERFPGILERMVALYSSH